jgi:hypothetical protein
MEEQSLPLVALRRLWPRRYGVHCELSAIHMHRLNHWVHCEEAKDHRTCDAAGEGKKDHHVVIVGAGIMGLTTAYYCHKLWNEKHSHAGSSSKKLKITVLDRHRDHGDEVSSRESKEERPQGSVCQASSIHNGAVVVPSLQKCWARPQVLWKGFSNVIVSAGFWPTFLGFEPPSDVIRPNILVNPSCFLDVEFLRFGLQFAWWSFFQPWLGTDEKAYALGRLASQCMTEV